MLITHDTGCALDTVVDLVNTAPEDDATPDGLPDVAALEVFVEKHEISEVGTLSELDLSAVRKIRGRFASVFAAPDARTAAAVINELVAAAGTTPASRTTTATTGMCTTSHPVPPSPITWRPTAGWRWRSSWWRVSRSGCAAARPRLPARLRGSLPQPLAAVLRQPYLRKPSARGRVPGTAQGSGGLTGQLVSTWSPAGDAGDHAYGSQHQQVVQRGHEQQTPDHRKKDHQRWLGKGEEASARLFLRRRGIALCRVQHLAAMMTQAAPPARSTRTD